MRVVVTGASGNVGTSVLRSLADEPAVDSIVGICRRPPAVDLPKTAWAGADVARDPLAPLLSEADAVIHLAWAIQPSRDPAALVATNLRGSERVFAAAATAGVGTVIHASSVGAYSPGPSHSSVDERWPTAGIGSSFYSRHKAAVERRLDVFEREHPQVRVVRIRPGLIFKREAASEIGRYFAGPLVPASLMRPGLLPLLPGVSGLRFQAVHSDDVGDAYRRALVGELRGPVNVAADPVLDSDALARVLRSRSLALPPQVVRAAAGASWRLRLQPTPAGWLDLALGSPIMDTARATGELGWRPRWSAEEALAELLAGLRAGAGAATPPLRPRPELRGRELATGIGAENP